MNLKDKISEIIDENEYLKFLKERNEKETYLYHFILVKYKDHNDICSIKIDTVSNLELLKDKDVMYKYYIEKIHYYNEFDNLLYDEGMPIHIFNLGYFAIDGDIQLSKQEKENLKQLFLQYEKEYSNLKFDFDDKAFLSLNK